jgi:hypothetical protein
MIGAIEALLLRGTAQPAMIIVGAIPHLDDKDLFVSLLIIEGQADFNMAGPSSHMPLFCVVSNRMTVLNHLKHAPHRPLPLVVCDRYQRLGQA